MAGGLRGRGRTIFVKTGNKNRRQIYRFLAVDGKLERSTTLRHAAYGNQPGFLQDIGAVDVYQASAWGRIYISVYLCLSLLLSDAATAEGRNADDHLSGLASSTALRLCG